MKLLQTEFFKELTTVILGTLFFTANCAFLLLPSALGRVPGHPMANTQPAAQQALSENDILQQAIFKARLTDNN